MKINSINNTLNSYNNQKTSSFKCSAVPYPEYASAYIEKEVSANVVENIVEKFSKLFTPKVNKEAAAIKTQINNIYETSLATPKKALLEVIA